MNRLNSFLKIIHLFLTIYLILFLNGGFGKFFLNYIPSSLNMFIVLFYIMITIASKRIFLNNYLLICYPLILFMAFMLLSTFFSNYNYLSMHITKFIYLFVCTIIFIYYKDEKKVYLRSILLIWFADLIFIGINSIIQLNNDPYIMRYLSTEAATSVVGVGSFAYIYTLPALFIILVDKTPKNIITYILICLVVYVIFKGNYTMSYLFTIIFLLIYIISRFDFKYKNIILVFSIPLLLLLIYKITPSVINYLIQNFNFDYEIEIRFKEILNFLQGNDINGTDLNSRINFYSYSINTFLNNIFIGSFGDGGIGMHSSWFDLLGLYGLLSLFFWLFMYKIYNFTLKIVNDSNLKIYKIVFLYFLVLGLFNTTLHSSLLLFIFVIVPFIFMVSDNNKTFLL